MSKLPAGISTLILVAAICILLAALGCDDDCTCPPEDQGTAPDGWFPLSGIPTTRELTSVCAFDWNTIVAAGDSGTVLRSTDGGDNWTLIQTATDSRFVFMSFTDADNGWLAGDGGALFKTTDGGVSWQARDAGTTGDLRVVFFVTADVGWIGGGPWPEQSAKGMLAYTENGGDTWTARSTSERVNVLFAVDADTACAGLSSGTILRTTDRGQTWEEYQSGATGWLGGIWFCDPLTAWLSGSGGLLAKSEDGGRIWTPVVSGTTRNLGDIYFLNTETGWLVGQLGTILKSTDGGATWTFRTSGTEAHLRMVRFADDDTGWIVGTGGTILKTVTAGEPIYR
jgi:photosystem II stability/assembly factor-like uncharacterized protein